MMLECKICKSYKGCIGAEWYSYADIRFCPLQIIWILQTSEILKGGEWPKETQTYSVSASQNVRVEAVFVKPELIWVETESRLEMTGLYGKLLVAEVEAGRDFNTLTPEAKEALMYIKGWKRKRMKFVDWLRIRRFRMLRKS